MELQLHFKFQNIGVAKCHKKTLMLLTLIQTKKFISFYIYQVIALRFNQGGKNCCLYICQCNIETLFKYKCRNVGDIFMPYKTTYLKHIIN